MKKNLMFSGFGDNWGAGSNGSGFVCAMKLYNHTGGG